MSRDDHNRALYERFVQEVMVQGNLQALDELVHADVVCHLQTPAPTPGLRGLKETFARLRTAFPDLTVSIRHIVGEGEKVVGHFTLRGTHHGEFMGRPATGKFVSYDEMAIARFEHGKIAELWTVADTLAMLQSIGAVEVTPHSSRVHRLPAATVERVRAFFERYAHRFNRSLLGEKVDAEDVAGSFASHFVEASPTGVNGGKNGLLFRWLIPRGFAHYRKIGTTAMHIVDLFVEPVDALHALAKVHWDAHYTKKDGSSDRIEFDVTYLLHFDDHGQPKIFAYITGDEERVLREHGLT